VGNVPPSKAVTLSRQKHFRDESAGTYDVLKIAEEPKWSQSPEIEAQTGVRCDDADHHGNGTAMS